MIGHTQLETAIREYVQDQRKRPVTTVCTTNQASEIITSSAVVREVMVDSSVVMQVEGRKRQRRSIAEKRRIVELAMLPGASVAGVARQHGVNANMVHYWRNLYRQGRLGEKRDESIRLLPVSVSEPAVAPALHSGSQASSASTVVPATTAGVIYLEFPKVHLRIESGADAALVRVVLESLQR